MMHERTRLLLGDEAFERLRESLVAVVGLGGVGGHCAEALARAGVGRLHLVDFDRVTESNLNRQLAATRATLGQWKTEAMRARIEAVSDCRLSLSRRRVDAESVADALPADADYIVDAIDQLSGKLALIDFARAHGIPILCCMGAGNRLDATRFTIRDVFDTAGDPLARRLRQGLRRMGVERLETVFSDEPPRVRPGQRTVGSLAPVTAAAGLAAASHVIRRLTGDSLS
ncbi:MAG: ThiF family adenylyltransferase [Clostridia bacterium]|nr:ThiF family adenylyltransferase [Clostridia bacterium]